MTEDKEDDDNYQALQKNAEILSEAKDQNGRKITLIPIKMPKSVNYDGSRLPASYANFYIGNAVVLVPTYGDSHDSTVVDSLKHIFTDRRVVGIDCRSLVYGLGAIHCVTQQQPQ
jgi:agmatine deiminase